jgi:uncharacterized protein YegP (UPF0339 family)
MARLIELTGTKTYATKANAIKAVDKVVKNPQYDNLRYMIITTDDGRFFPCFIGQECLQAGIHFHFAVVA